ncbi:MAG: DUF512 domain-containing protein [Chitinispirillia bacterium]|nr:DUF512 domain-containing protein [Chitinispirillia bacterium]MCL2241300.1 DUF512 domain-containing protein [Chitinispirillia bacterium]
MAGLRPRDRILAVNGSAVADELDFYYHAAGDFLEIDIERGGRVGTVEVERPPGASLEADFHEKPVNRCRNRCVFCFIDQMPKGLRRSLYVKDEDFKHSFLNGNYVTLASASRSDLGRIASIGLSPLFISVHATDPAVRAVLLGNRRLPDIREQLAFLRDNGIAFHTQIVLCPGINDGEALRETAAGLAGYGKSLLSVAVVPVGLTRFRKKPLAPVDKDCAVKVCKEMGEMSDRMKAADGARKLFLADEFFIRAGLAIPPASYYEDYPQIENGVGLVRQFLQEGARVKRKLRGCTFSKKRRLVITGCSALPYVKKVYGGIYPSAGKDFDVVPVVNHYFGETVTVTGLLTAADVIKKIKESSSNTKYNEVILPRVMFNHCGYTLDGYSPARIAKSAGLAVRVVESVEEAVNAG